MYRTILSVHVLACVPGGASVTTLPVSGGLMEMRSRAERRRVGDC